MTFEKDRRFLERETRKLAGESTVPGAERIPGLLETSYRRRFLKLSLRNKVNVEWACAADETSKDVSLEQLQGFIAANLDWQDNASI